jgi:sulfoxide reductase heme-binding subunit YedZ
VGVDPVRCGRFGFCEHEAPRVFSLRADGRLSYAASVPADQLDAVVQAMKVCPARAISVNHAPTVRMTSPPPKPPEPSGPRGGGRVGGSRRGAAGRGRRSSPTATHGVHRLDGSPVRGESW